MLLGIVNEALRGFDDGMCTIVVFLDLSAAFDTVDTKKLFNILENRNYCKCIEVVQFVFNWLHTTC